MKWKLLCEFSITGHLILCVFLTGDDDTIFFVDAAMDLVKDLDPEMPYFLTGMLYLILQTSLNE